MAILTHTPYVHRSFISYTIVKFRFRFVTLDLLRLFDNATILKYGLIPGLREAWQQVEEGTATTLFRTVSLM